MSESIFGSRYADVKMSLKSECAERFKNFSQYHKWIENGWPVKASVTWGRRNRDWFTKDDELLAVKKEFRIGIDRKEEPQNYLTVWCPKINEWALVPESKFYNKGE